MDNRFRKIQTDNIPCGEQFLKYLEIECGLYYSTVKRYFGFLHVFFDFLEGEYSLREPREVKIKHLRSFLVYLKNERGNAPSTRNNYVTTLKKYFSFLLFSEEMEIIKDPTQFLKFAKVPQKVPVYLTLEESEKLLSAARESGEMPYRDHAMLRLMLQTGCRTKELLKLKLTDLDLQEKSVRLDGKNRKERCVPLTDNTCLALEEYLQSRWHNQSESLFISKNDRPLNRAAAAEILKKAAADAGIQKEGVTLHKLRHSCLTLLLKEGVDLNVLKKLADHNTIRTTVKYTHITRGDMRNAIIKNPLDDLDL